ncbi:MAG: hypothetical protein KGI29_05500 [Pseudomonadota bacterium]|nr:hypothetical protein [Pseudomonadota bacterium]MDE3037780.1 hypothetical protein [Pseudomonadota bacterium]
MGKRKRKQKKGIQGEGAAAPEACLPTPEFAAKNALEKVKTDQGSHTLRVRDKRPIDKYHRLYMIDQDRGVGERYRRGITEEQYRAADRLANNYERTVHNLSNPLDAVRVQVGVNVALFPVESIMQAIHLHARVMKELSRGSQEIVELVCCKEKSLMNYEASKAWRRGYGMLRLREALDELISAFRFLGKRRHDENGREHPFS